MADVQIDSDDVFIPGVNFTENGVDQPAPAEFHWILYCKSGGIYLRKHDGTVIGPLTDGSVKTMHITEVDGAPFLLPGVLEFPNGTITDQGNGVARYTPAAAPPGGDYHYIGESVITGSPSPNLTYDNIPQTYSIVVAEIMMRGDRNLANDDARITVNDDAGNNYNIQGLTVSGSTAGGTATALQPYWTYTWVPAATAPAAQWGYLTLRLNDYALTTNTKVIDWLARTRVNTGATQMRIDQLTAFHLSTAAITKLNLAMQNGNFIVGSRIRLYGIT